LASYVFVGGAGRHRGVTATFIGANAQTYPFEQESFDLIVSRFGGDGSSQDSVEAPATLRRAARGGGSDE
jgi:ubiquinone/menaquinone biosynthesis C-methylase UbiE